MTIDKDALDTLRMDKDTAADAAERRAAPWVFGTLVLLVVAAGAAAWFFLRPVPATVSTTVVQRASQSAPGSEVVLTASGYVVARRISTPSSKITAQVISVHVEEGMAVAEGDVLARLDDTTPRAQLSLAESQLERARQAVTESRVRLAEAERTLARNEALVKQNLVSQSVLDASDAEVKALRARIRVATSEVRVAERSMAVARQAVEDTVVRAPFAGVVISKDAQPGEMISPISAGGGFTRTGICTIVDMDSLEVEVDVNEAYINRVHAGQPVESVLDAYPGWKIPSHVINIVPTADRQKATVKVRIGFDVKDERILPDMGVQVRFKQIIDEAAGDPVARLQVPDGAVVRRDGSEYVYVVHGETVERRAVKTAPGRGGAVGVVAGLQAGDVVVLDPPAALADGMAVTIQK